MISPFEDLNVYTYHRLRCVALDIVIWCLGPVVDDTRRYGRLRQGLAIATCHACRRWYGIR